MGAAGEHNNGSEGRRRKGRPQRPVLGPDRIAATALAIIESSGTTGLTMRRLAKELDTAVSAIYNHVRSKADVMNCVQDYLYQYVDASAFATDPWDIALIRWARSYRTVFSGHCGFVPVLAHLPVSTAPRALAMYECAAKALQRAGWPMRHVVDVIVSLESFILGSAMDATADSGILHVLEPQLAPTFASAVSERNGHYPADDAFDLGLEAFVEGLRKRLHHTVQA